MLPGKGVHLVLNQSVLDAIEGPLEEISLVYSDARHDSEPGEVLRDLLNTEGWEEAKDSFGHKAFRKVPYKKGELRVTVVLTKQDELRLDIREWYEPEMR